MSTDTRRWFYWKVYLPETAQDDFLLKLYRLVGPDTALNQINFFFVRYRDDKPHLRLRWLDNEELSIHKFRALCQQLDIPEEDLCSEVYVPERERYGKDWMPAAERFFAADTLAFLHWRASAEVTPASRFAFGWLCAKTWLETFLPDRDIQCNWLERQELYLREWLDLDDQTLEDKAHYLPTIWAAVSAPSPEAAQAIEYWKKQASLILSDTPDIRPGSEPLASHIHLCANRIFPQHANMLEWNIIFFQSLLMLRS